MNRMKKALAASLAATTLFWAGCSLRGEASEAENEIFAPDIQGKVASGDISWSAKIYTDAGIFSDTKNDWCTKYLFSKDNKLLLKQYYQAPAETTDWQRWTIEEVIYDKDGNVQYIDVYPTDKSYNAGTWKARYSITYDSVGRILRIEKYKDSSMSTIIEYADFTYPTSSELIPDTHIELHNLVNGDRKSTIHKTVSAVDGDPNCDTRVSVEALMNQNGTYWFSVDYFYKDSVLMKTVLTNLSTGGITRNLYKHSDGKSLMYRDGNYNSVIDDNDVLIRDYRKFRESVFNPFDPMNTFNVFNCYDYLTNCEQSYYADF